MSKCIDCLHYNICTFGKCDIISGCPFYTARSEWVHLPCKVGNSIFCDGKLFADRYAGEIMEFTADIVRTQVCTTHCGEIDMVFNFKDFGKTVFLTREEAERAKEKIK